MRSGFLCTSLNRSGAGWTYQQTYGFDPAGSLNAIGFGDHSFRYGYVPNSNLIQTFTSRTAGNQVVTATKTWDNINRLYRIQSTSTATVGGLSQTFPHVSPSSALGRFAAARSVRRQRLRGQPSLRHPEAPGNEMNQ